ncbi:glycosyltransferase family 4 protein [Clostridium chauvoei]|nr:glycosyltransferase family 4 protein [Clostridium chauvoei]
MYSTPPITFEKVINYIKSRDGAKSYLLLKDIFPQNAVDIEMMKESSIIYKYFRKKENKLYAASDYIGCMSDKNKEYLLEHNKELREEKVEVCPNSIDPLPFSKLNLEEKIALRDKYKIPKDALVIVYGGNLGRPQGINFLIEILKANKDNKEVFFLIVGNGTEYNKLKAWFDDNQGINAALYSLLPKADYDNLVKACDIGLILLDNRFTIPNFPSRLLSYMEVGIPVLAATDKNTDVGIVIENGKFGYWCESGNIEAFNTCIKKMITEKESLVDMGIKGREYLENNYTVKHSSDIILNRF